MLGAAEPEAQVVIGDAWWDFAQAVQGPNKSAILAHAGEWYARATPELKGLVKAKVEKRLAQLEPKEAGASPPHIKPHAGKINVLLFKGNGKGVEDFQTLSAGRITVAQRDQIATLFANPKDLSQYSVMVWEANALCDSQVEFDDQYGATMRRFVENGGDIVLFEQFRTVNWSAIEKPFGIKRVPGGPHEFGWINAELGAKLRQANVGEDELAKARFAIAVEMPDRSTILVKNKRGQTIAGVMLMGKGRVIYTGGNGDADHAKFDHVFFKCLFPVE